MTKWSITTFIANIWNLISITMWPALKENPEGLFLMIENFVEIWLLLDVLVRIVLRIFFKEFNAKCRFMHAKSSDSKIHIGIILFASIP